MHPNYKLTDKEFLEHWNKHQSLRKMAADYEMNYRSLCRRRRAIEKKLGKPLIAPEQTERSIDYRKQHENKTLDGVETPNLGILNGTVICFSDCHYWPGVRSTSHKALLWAIEKFKPTAVIAGGDVFDGASVSRHSPIMFGHMPSVKEELDAVRDRLGEIEETAKKARHNVRLVWTYGNHDQRYSTFLASNAPQYANIKGTSLKDFFPEWLPCWLVWLNNDTIVKHRFKGGAHATYNNTLHAGKNLITGHLHQLVVRPFADYNGNRYGVDMGTIADVYSAPFKDYTELGPLNWRSGFVVLTFKDGVLLWPEVVMKYKENKVEFRGEIVDVSAY